MDSSPRPSAPPPGDEPDDAFTLWDLRVEVVAVPGRKMVCNHPEGTYFDVRGEELHFQPGTSFPMYPLAALLPLLPAKQRMTAPADWMSTDMDIACPDPHCGALFRITRTARRTFRHGDVTAVPLPTGPGGDSDG
ncbi:MAG: TIGR04076 family protein [Acidobacteriota bacterium]